MLKRIVRFSATTFLLFAAMLVLGTSASAQQVLQYYSDHCTRPIPGIQEGMVTVWNNESGQPSCSLGATKWGNHCYLAFPYDVVETETNNLHQNCITTWSYEHYVTVTPACSGTPSQEFLITDHTCCQ